jgi:hypothetical protein
VLPGEEYIKTWEELLRVVVGLLVLNLSGAGETRVARQSLAMTMAIALCVSIPAFGDKCVKLFTSHLLGREMEGDKLRQLPSASPNANWAPLTFIIGLGWTRSSLPYLRNGRGVFTNVGRSSPTFTRSIAWPVIRTYGCLSYQISSGVNLAKHVQDVG